MQNNKIHILLKINLHIYRVFNKNKVKINLIKKRKNNLKNISRKVTKERKRIGQKP